MRDGGMEGGRNLRIEGGVIKRRRDGWMEACVDKGIDKQWNE